MGWLKSCFEYIVCCIFNCDSPPPRDTIEITDPSVNTIRHNISPTDQFPTYWLENEQHDAVVETDYLKKAKEELCRKWDLLEKARSIPSDNKAEKRMYLQQANHNGSQALLYLRKYFESNQGQQDDVLDIHHFTKKEAKQAVEMFLELKSRDICHESTVNVHIITGKGNHSADGAVLKPFVEELLMEKRLPYSYPHGNEGKLKVVLTSNLRHKL